MGQISAVIAMLLVTLIAALVLLIPIRLKFGSDLVKFYWRGVWYFLSAIAVVSGGAQVLMLMGYDVEQLSIAVLAGLMTAYVLFVVFGWFRLIGAALLFGVRKMGKTG